MASSRHKRNLEPGCPIDLVQIDGLAVMKIIKHCHEEGAGNMEVAQGVLLGLVVENKLEVTNCFPFPRHAENIDEEEYQLEMMRHLRKVNVDHISVGWYQSTFLSSYISTQLLESQFSYQTSIEESVVIIYDPIKTSRGFLSLKAYRLTPQAMSMVKEGDYTADAIKKNKVQFESMFQEIKVVIRNSHLINALLSELCELLPEDTGSPYLDLGTAPVLEKHLRCIMDCVDELVQESSKYNIYHRQCGKQQQEKHRYQQKRAAENAARQAKGEALLPEEDLNKLFKPIPPPPRLDSMISSGQVLNYCQQVSQFCSQSLGKLFTTEALHSDNIKPTL